MLNKKAATAAPPKPTLDLAGDRIVNIKLTKETVHHAKTLCHKDGQTFQGLVDQLLSEHVRNNRHRL